LIGEGAAIAARDVLSDAGVVCGRKEGEEEEEEAASRSFNPTFLAFVLACASPTVGETERISDRRLTCSSRVSFLLFVVLEVD
jgi:hypothetical protein